MNAERCFDVLIVGCGKIAGGFDAERAADAMPFTHAGAFNRHPAFRLAACIEPDDATREAFMARWKVPLGFRTLPETERAGVQCDVISICSPTVCHAADLEMSLRLRPRAVFCEKPLSTSLKDSERLVRACGEAGALLAVNYTRRWAPDVVRLKQQLDRGEWGQVRSVAGVYNKGILNNGGHLVDLISYLVGSLSLIAAGDAVHDFWPDDPTASALLRTESGVPVTLATGDARDYTLFELRLVTSSGTIVMEDGGLNWRVRKSVDSPLFKSFRTLGPAIHVEGEYARAMTLAVANLHDALVHDSPLASTGQTAVQAQRVCEQVRAAALSSSSPS